MLSFLLYSDFVKIPKIVDPYVITGVDSYLITGVDLPIAQILQME